MLNPVFVEPRISLAVRLSGVSPQCFGAVYARPADLAQLGLLQSLGDVLVAQRTRVWCGSSTDTGIAWLLQSPGDVFAACTAGTAPGVLHAIMLLWLPCVAQRETEGWKLSMGWHACY